MRDYSHCIAYVGWYYYCLTIRGWCSLHHSAASWLVMRLTQSANHHPGVHVVNDDVHTSAVPLWALYRGDKTGSQSVSSETVATAQDGNDKTKQARNM
jgi:hypothetical protein